MDIVTAAVAQTHKASSMQAYAQGYHEIQIPLVANHTRGWQFLLSASILAIGVMLGRQVRVWAGRRCHACGDMSGVSLGGKGEGGVRVQARTADVKRVVPGLLPSLDGRSSRGVQQGL